MPLAAESVDVAVFCLALMGTNLQEILGEANRVLKLGYAEAVGDWGMSRDAEQCPGGAWVHCSELK